jgi:hypothetical protein
MGLVTGIFLYLGCFVFLGLVAYYLKWILAGISILTGDKESLHDYGDLCDPTLPPPPKNEWRQGYGWQNRDRDWRNWGEGNMS